MSRTLWLDAAKAPIGAAMVAAAVAALCAGAADAQQMPTDVELKAAYCLAVTKKQIEGMEHAKVSDPAAQQYIKTTLRDAKDRLRRLQPYLTPRMQTLEPMSILAAMNRGEADYTNYNQRMNEVAPECILNCGVLDATGKARAKAIECLNRCLEKDDLIERVNSCSNLSWLPF